MYFLLLWTHFIFFSVSLLILNSKCLLGNNLLMHLYSPIQSLTHFMPLVSFHKDPWKYQETRGSLMFSEGIEREQRLEMSFEMSTYFLQLVFSYSHFPKPDFLNVFSGYRKRPVVRNGLSRNMLAKVKSCLRWIFCHANKKISPMDLYPVIKKLRMSGACLEPVHVYNPFKRLRWSFFA